MRTANPALTAKTFEGFVGKTITEVMTLEGTVNKSVILLALTVASAAFTWNLFYKESPLILPLMILGLIGGLITAIITIFKKEWAPVTAPIYVILEGLLLGAISSLMESQFPGIVIQAVALTFGTLFCLLFVYKFRLIKVTENFKLGVVAATGAVALIYFVTMILNLFSISTPYIHDSGMIGIGFSLFVVVIAALNLVLDFDFIEKGAENRVPKYMEWYAAFGLMVTLIWLYLEILRLLGKTRRR